VGVKKRLQCWREGGKRETWGGQEDQKSEVVLGGGQANGAVRDEKDRIHESTERGRRGASVPADLKVAAHRKRGLEAAGGGRRFCSSGCLQGRRGYPRCKQEKPGAAWDGDQYLQQVTGGVVLQD